MISQIDIAMVIDQLVPSAEYEGSLTSNTEEAYWGIIWKDERPKPTWQQVIDAAEGNSTYSQNASNSQITLPKKKEMAKDLIDSMRVSAERQGMSYSFNSVSDIVQLRDVDDFINILGIVSTAQVLLSKGIDEIILFRANSNTTYQLTPEEAITLGLAVSNFRQSLYEKAWKYKEDVDSCKSKIAVDSILNDITWN